MENKENRKNNISLIYIPIISFFLIFGLLHLHEKFISLLSFQNIVHLSMALSVVLFSFLTKEKNVFDWLITIILVRIVVGGPLKAFFYNDYFYDLFNYLFTCLCLIFIWLLIGKTLGISKWYGLLTGLLLLFVQLICFAIIKYFPSTWLLQYDHGKVVFDFFSISYMLNCLLQSLALLTPSLFLIYKFYIKNHRTHTIHPRNVLEFAGIFILASIGQIRVLFIFESYMSGWTHSLLEIVGFTPLLFWFIALRCDEEDLQADNKQLTWAMHISLFLPLIYFFIAQPEIRKLLIIITILIILELIFILFSGLISLRSEVLKLGRQLRETGDYLTHLWSNEEEGFVITNNEGEVVDASHSLFKLSGIEIQGKNLNELLGKNENVASGMPRAIQDNRLWLTSADGTPHPITIHSRIFDGSPEPLTINVIRDLQQFEQKQKMNQQMQEQVLRLQKMESVIRMGGDFAHNFNNFLNGINAYAEMIRLTVNNNDYESVNKYLTGLFTEISRSSAYVQKVIDTTQLESPEMKQVDLQRALQESLSLITRVIDLDKYEFSIDIPDSCRTVFGISQDITEIFYQLLWNAVEAMPSGGSISLKAKLLPPEKEDVVTGNHFMMPYLQIAVSDTGIGIAMGTKDQIFDPFFSTKNKVGKGLGLTITYALVKRHKGIITCSNNPVKGATFVFTLPAFPEVFIPTKT